MTQRRAALALIAAAPTLWLAACSREELAASPASPPIETPQAWDVLSKEAKGFTVGAMMSAHTVYVLFDPQCGHCGHLWQAALPLLNRIKFVWAPVAMLGPKSLPQSAALLQATNPVEAMTAHETSLLAGQGGTAASATVPAEIEAAIKANTALLDRMRAEAVPFVVAKHAISGQSITHTGALDTARLLSFLGLSNA